MSDPIERQAAIDALDEQIRQCDKALSAFDISMKDEYAVKVERASLVAFRDTLEYMPSAQPGWIPCSEKMPPDYQWYYATCKSLVDNRENWVVEGCYTPWEHFDSTPMIKCGQAEVIAWMPKEFPKPWEGGKE